MSDPQPRVGKELPSSAENGFVTPQPKLHSCVVRPLGVGSAQREHLVPRLKLFLDLVHQTLIGAGCSLATCSQLVAGVSRLLSFDGFPVP